MSVLDQAMLTEEDYNVIYEPDFITFNKIRTVLCRNSPCIRGKRCTFAHKPEELRKSICLYHFNNGCTKSASVCQHSHDDKELDKSIIDYKKWKTPSPKPEIKKLSDEELIKQFGEFKISLDSESEEDDEDMKNCEDESDRKMVKLIKSCSKTTYETRQTNDIIPYPEEWKNIPGISSLLPPENCEGDNSDIKLSVIVANQQVMITNMLNQIQYLMNKVQELENK